MNSFQQKINEVREANLKAMLKMVDADVEADAKTTLSQSIELDCAPGGIRPWHLIQGVIEGTGLIVPVDAEGNATNPGCLFGLSEWLFKMPRAEWVAKIQPIIKPRIEALYHGGKIRWGSW